MKFLHKIFGPSKNAVWAQFCIQIGADYESISRWSDDSVICVKHRNWTVVLDAYEIPYGRFPMICTRFHIVYFNKEGFKFSLKRRDIISNLTRFLGVYYAKVGPPQINPVEPLFGVASYINMKDVESNYCDFDKIFVIKATNEAKLRAIFKDLKLRELIQSQKSLSIKASDFNQNGANLSHDIYELCINVPYIVRDVQELVTLYNITIYVMDALCNIGSADESPTNYYL